MPSASTAVRSNVRSEVRSSVRIDKWLWAARFFKTRALATRACDMGRVQSNGQPAKPSREVRVNDALRIKTERGDFGIKVLGLAEVRGSATVAQALYEETEESRQERARADALRRQMAPFEIAIAGEGRPTKRNRRDLNRLRNRS